MGRKPRIYFSGAIYHITVRGNNKENIFNDEIDNRKYLKIIRECQNIYNFLLYAYILMPNHIHFIIEPSDKADISKIMHRLSTNYAKYFTWKYKKVGHVYQSRFFSNIIAKDEYLLNAVRYVLLNPVRAKLVSSPYDWPRSSIHAYLGKDNNNLKVDTSFVLNILSLDRKEQVSALNEFLFADMTEKDKELKQKISTSFFVGSDSYVNQMNRLFKIGQKKRGRPFKKINGARHHLLVGV